MYNLTKEDFMNRGVLAADPNGKQIQIITSNGIKWINANSDSGSGYIKFIWRYKGKIYTARAHKINYVFNVGNVPDGFEIDHFDADKTNNELDNLHLVTKSDNCRKAVTQRNIKHDHNVYSTKSDDALKLIYIKLLAHDELTQNQKVKLKLLNDELTRRNII